MAIAHTITEEQSHYGIAFNGAYWRIVTASVQRINGDDPKFQVNVDLSAYATNTPTENTAVIDFKRFHAPWDIVQAHSGDSFIDKCYNYVMAQPEMAGSTAV